MVKILFEHANEFNYCKESFHSLPYANCLIVRISLEKGDELKIREIDKAIREVFSILKPQTIILFPFSHLSNDLIAKRSAEILFNELTIVLKELPVVTLPFGVNKGYRIDIKNHKLNNIFRSL